MTAPSQDARRSAPATARNREPILSVLQRALPARGLVLEIASGTGEHAVFFSRALPGLTWQPTDVDDGARASIDAWAAAEGPDTLRPAVALDVTARPWPVAAADAVVCINMVHISPPECTPALLEGAAAVLPEGAPLVLYGPFRIGGAHTSESNAAFDDWLKAQDPSFGIRNLDDVAALAAEHGFGPPETIQMPANNLTVVFRRG
ncbi:DUF938 domain-containing protein [Caenispirillum salinarum]|uniref:DUF938 domain-containing protein n=1 Tax=Caenispirillum salinarum TaxID=859058 RepID=UPI0038504C0D